MRSELSDHNCGVELLCADLNNSLLHCFGVHKECSIDYCKEVQPTTLNIATDNSNTSTLSISLGSIASLEVQQWNDDLDEDNMEESWSDSPTQQDLDPAMLLDIQQLVGRLIGKVDQCLGKLQALSVVVLYCSTTF